MYHIFIDNDRPQIDPMTVLRLEYLHYRDGSTGVLINLKGTASLTGKPEQQIAIQGSSIDAYRFHPNDIEAIIKESGGIDWESKYLEPFNLEYDLRVKVEYPNIGSVFVTGERFMNRLPLSAYGITSHLTNITQPNAF